MADDEDLAFDFEEQLKHDAPANGAGAAGDADPSVSDVDENRWVGQPTVTWHWGVVEVVTWHWGVVEVVTWH
eukprot:gene6183-6421_t